MTTQSYGKIFPGLYIGTEAAASDRELLRYELDISHLIVIERPERRSQLPKSHSIDFEIFRVEDVNDPQLSAHEVSRRFIQVNEFIEKGQKEGTAVFLFGCETSTSSPT